MELISPTLDRLELYSAAVERNVETSDAESRAFLEAQLRQISEDPIEFIAMLDNLEGRPGEFELPNGTKVPRLASFTRWIWDGDICGSIMFRWQKNSVELPDYVLGHIGYGVFSWKRGRGYAKRALALMLEEVRPLGLPYVELTTDPDNLASQRVILANGGVLIERFTMPEIRGGGESLRFRIPLTSGELFPKE